MNESKAYFKDRRIDLREGVWVYIDSGKPIENKEIYFIGKEVSCDDRNCPCKRR